jgi:hypothetical protein
MRLGRDGSINLTCPRCGHTNFIRVQANFADEGEHTWSVANPEMPCLTCGRVLRHEGVIEYQTTWGVLRAVARAATAEELRQISGAIEELSRRSATVEADELAGALESTDTDAGRTVAGWVRRNGGWLPIATFVVAVLALINDLVGGPPSTPMDPEPRGYTEEQVERIIETLRGQYEELAPGPSTKSRLGRNDPCWCGSAKKYKKCHGRPKSVLEQERKQAPRR